MMNCKVIFSKINHTAIAHAGKLPGKSAALHAEVVRQNIAVHGQNDLSGFLALYLLREESDQFLAD